MKHFSSALDVSSDSIRTSDFFILNRPTQRAADWWKSPRFLAAWSRPACQRLTRAVGLLRALRNRKKCMSIHTVVTHINRALLKFMLISLIFVTPSCGGLSLSPFITQTPLPLPSLTPTQEECSWYGLMLAWSDNNGNGVKDADEPPLANIRFFSENPSHKSEKSDYGTTGTGGSIGLVELLPGCVHLRFEVYPEVPENCELTTTPARMLADTRKEHQEFSFGFLCSELFSNAKYHAHKSHLTQRAADCWQSARFPAAFRAPAGCRQSGVVSFRPPAGNASRWAATFQG